MATICYTKWCGNWESLQASEEQTDSGSTCKFLFPPVTHWPTTYSGHSININVTVYNNFVTFVTSLMSWDREKRERDISVSLVRRGVNIHSLCSFCTHLAAIKECYLWLIRHTTLSTSPLTELPLSFLFLFLSYLLLLDFKCTLSWLQLAWLSSVEFMLSTGISQTQQTRTSRTLLL